MMMRRRRRRRRRMGGSNHAMWNKPLNNDLICLPLII
jgi:hypothetical protein